MGRQRDLPHVGAVALSLLTFELVLHPWLVSRFGSTVSYAARYGLVLVLAAMAVRERPARTWAMTAAGALLVVAALSIAWSPNLGAALRVVVDLVFILVAGVSGAVAVPHPRAVIAVARGLAAAVLAHLIGLILISDSRVGIHGERSWSGLLLNENDFGRQMVFTAVIAAAASVLLRRYIVLLLTALFLALMSGSSQVVVVAAGVLVATAVVAKTPAAWLRSRRHQSFLLVAVGVFVVLLVTFWNTILGILGKDATLSLRVPLWEGVLDVFADRWWSGYGAGNVWHNPAIEDELFDSAGFAPAQAHNSFLEAGMQWGVTGIVLLVGLLAIAFIAGARALRRAPSLGIASFGLAAAVLLYSLSASVIGRAPVEVYWFILLLFVVQAEQMVRLGHDGTDEGGRHE